MRPTVAVLLFALLAGCGAGTASLPYHSMARGSMAIDDPGMTVEQYALDRLPAAHRGPDCVRPALTALERATRKICRK
jgi:hypothetical protein